MPLDTALDGELLARYQSFAVYRVAERSSAQRGAIDCDYFDIIRLRGGDIDTATAAPMDPDSWPESGMFLVQFVAPPHQAWLEAVRGAGLDIIAPVPFTAVLVRGRQSDVAAVGRLDYVQWCAPYGPAERLHPELVGASKGAGAIAVSIEVLQDGNNVLELQTKVRAGRVPPTQIGRFVILRGEIDPLWLATLAERSDVVDISPWREPEMLDERAGIIAAGRLDASGRVPQAPGYAAWLAALGFGGQFDFGIDFADSGLDTGTPGGPGSHPDFGSAAGTSRVVYATSYTPFSGTPADYYGHGTLNASIAAGWNQRSATPWQDPDGYNYGLGIAPFALIGSSKIFDDGPFTVSTTFTNIAAYAYQRGMRVLSNSWGARGNEYTAESQEYDSIVRDADPGTDGNQEVTVVFAAGNSYGGGRIYSPGTAKNVITVGATEGYRPDGVEDGCEIGDSGADGADDIINFSSGGPVDDGRSKPDLVAPGTHIQGAASQHPFYRAGAICGGPGQSSFYPAGQTLYTWSSGTSHATPVVAGAAALLRQFAIDQDWLDGAPPSPAMIKALLLSATTPVGGANAGPTLPDPRQGFGRVNLAPLFDDAARILVDQTVRFSDSGQVEERTGRVGDPVRPFRVALAWTDAPGLPSTAPQVNDLDLEVRVGDTVYRGNRFDGFYSTPNPSDGPDLLNNVEVVTIPAGVGGDFVVTVRASRIIGDGVPGDADLTDQDFALVVYNIDDGRWTPPDPPVVTSVELRNGGTFKLLVAGYKVGVGTQVEINDLPVPADRLRYLDDRHLLKVRWSPKRLGIVAGANRLVAITDGLRSAPFTFSYAP